MSDQSRLRWLCRRGMKELDVVMTRYLDDCYATANQVDQRSFRIMLEMPDPDLFALLVGRKNCDDIELNNLIDVLRNMVRQARPI